MPSVAALPLQAVCDCSGAQLSHCRHISRHSGITASNLCSLQAGYLHPPTSALFGNIHKHFPIACKSMTVLFLNSHSSRNRIKSISSIVRTCGVVRLAGRSVKPRRAGVDGTAGVSIRARGLLPLPAGALRFQPACDGCARIQLGTLGACLEHYKRSSALIMYCFIHGPAATTALRRMHRLCGKAHPDTTCQSTVLDLSLRPNCAYISVSNTLHSAALF